MQLNKTMEIPFTLNRRKRTARRVYKSNPLFAVQIVADKLSCEYDMNLLTSDLILKTSTKRQKTKSKPRFDFRFMQLKKMSEIIISSTNEKEKQSLINRYVPMVSADKKRQDIVLTVTYSGKSKQFFFHWSTKEQIIKEIASMANKVNSFEEFEILKNNYLKSVYNYGN